MADSSKAAVWTNDELRLLDETLDRPFREVATLLGRSEKAVQLKRYQIKRESRAGAKIVNQDPWADDDYAFLEDHRDWPARKVADAMGRSLQSVYTKRWRLDHGWEPRQQAWDVFENEIILAAGPYSTAKGLAPRLPGRSLEAIAIQRRRLGVDMILSHLKRPDAIGARPLIAKTCRACGLLLPSGWFVFLPRNRGWSSSCKKCRSANQSPQRLTDEQLEKRWEAARQSSERLQALTLQHADRMGIEYVEEDHKVLSDPDLSVLQKALQLGRTYKAARAACSRNGYKSHHGLGDPDRDIWIIDNPNEERLTS